MRNPLVTPALIVAAGFGFFIAVVLVATGLAYYNADVTPGLPWFPLLVLPALFAAVLAIDRRWNISLALPAGTRWTPIVAFAFASMIASHCVLILEGAFHGLTREFEAAPEGVTPAFAAVYWISIVVAMSTASEVAFRGIMQGRLTPLLGMWPGLLIPLIVNTVSHRWDGLYERTLGVICILFAWGYLRHLIGSLTPTIITHIATIIVWDALLWTIGPWDQAAMSPGALWATAFIGVVALAASVWLARTQFQHRIPG